MTLVCHIAIPAGNNAAGVSWQNAIVGTKKATASVLVDGDGSGSNGTISSAEKTELATGQKVERLLPFDLGADWGIIDSQTKQARIDAAYNKLVTKVQSELSGQLQYFGFTR